LADEAIKLVAKRATAMDASINLDDVRQRAERSTTSPPIREACEFSQAWLVTMSKKATIKVTP